MLFLGGAHLQAALPSGAEEFHRDIQPLLKNYCYDCHADGVNKGKVAFDQFKTDEAVLTNRDLWWKALKNLRAGLMPPARKPRPTAPEQELITRWIKASVFDSDPQNPDPGHVTIRRLNRSEYHNTVRDLLGVDFDTQAAFPPDDTGYGFDTIGDVLTLSPMLLEKYMDAAEKIVSEAVPAEPKVVAKRVIDGHRFRGLGDGGGSWEDGLELPYFKAASITNTMTVQWAGQYKLGVDLAIHEHYVDGVFDYNKCRLIFAVDGRELWRREFSWEGGKTCHYDFDQDWAAGGHVLSFQLQPLTPDLEQTRSLRLQITAVTVSGPMAGEHWVQPDNYTRFFPKPVPAGAKERRLYAREILSDFARRAFRRPVDKRTVDGLTALAEGVYSQPGQTFESGVAEGMVAVLASPRFLFREETMEPGDGRQLYPLIDEYSLASRLSYFLWSSMPDEELFRLAAGGHLRRNLSTQVDRMLHDRRAEAFVRDFTGQWLRGRDVETTDIDPISVLARERAPDPERAHLRKRYHELNDKPESSLTKAERAELAGLLDTFKKKYAHARKANFDGELRYAMRRETEEVFGCVLRQDRSLLELLDSDYTFLNQRLAAHYGIPGVTGSEMRRVTLPPDSWRGGVLTEGTVLVATSNPTRTSPVKRGLFILDSILGTPPPPPPPNIPPLEDAARHDTNHSLSLRQTLALHRNNPLCSSCHSRMDPLGLAFENFNAMGMWRSNEFNQPIDATGTLITGESFSSVRELKHILVTRHARDFYRTLTEKMLTYALGRGLEYYDVETVDQIVARLEADGGKPSTLLAGLVESAPFQKCRRPAGETAALPSAPPVVLNTSVP